MSTEKLPFKTELKQVLDIIVHSLYSHRDIFLRELISNACDAIDTLRFQSLTKQELLEGDPEWKMKITANKDQGTLTVSDNGIGMSRESIVENLGTIARSGTKAFLQALQQADVQQRPELIGQFGVGFYSSFMVADKVTVISRQAGDPPNRGVRWESDGQGEFSVEDVEKEKHGTDVILHLKDDAREFLEEWTIRSLVKKHSDYVEHAIVMDVEREDENKKSVVEETLNSQKAIWLRPKAEVTKEQHADFYQHLAHDFQAPAKIIHYSAEGAVEFRALLYIPAHKPYDLLWNEKPTGLQLYIRRVFIMDDCEALLPRYLRFVKGVVDSPDLPLNVSREMLQQSAPLEKIKSNLTLKVLKTLEEMKTNEYDAYLAFCRELGIFLKEGIHQDRSNKEALADLLLYESTRTDKGSFTTLQKYVAGMAGDQNEILYLIGEHRELIENSPFLESFKEKGQEVLLMTDPIDEFVVSSLYEYKGKRLRAVDRGTGAGDEVPEDKKKRYGPLLDFMKQKLSDLKDVRLSRRLKESAACLVTDEAAMGAHMERLLQRIGKGGEVPPAQRILEVNPDHRAVDAMEKVFAKEGGSERVERYCKILYDQALLTEGSRIKDPSGFAQRINDLLLRDAGG